MGYINGDRRQIVPFATANRIDSSAKLGHAAATTVKVFFNYSQNTGLRGFLFEDLPVKRSAFRSL